MEVNNANDLPPILEMEDQPDFRSLPPQTPPPIDAAPLFHPGDDSASYFEMDKQEENDNTKGPPYLGPERQFSKISDHTQFWSTYDRVAGAYDREFLDAWNKSLDVLLIFAGLFSAINTAFIIESHRGLQSDPMETTNALLRLFISHRNDNATLSVADLNPESLQPSAIAVNSIFFSSLSFSLTAAFGAVTAKQWLTEYNNVGAMKAVHIQGKERQKKYNGLKTWHLQLVIELLPTLLQISLLLFLVGVVHFLWNLDRKVAIVQLILSGIGLAVYFVTIIIGIIDPASPFRTPLSIYIPRYVNKAARGLKTLLEPLVSFHPLELMVETARKLQWINAVVVAFNQLNFIETLKSHRVFVGQGLAKLRKGVGYATVVDTTDSELVDADNIEWDTEDITAAEAVVWLLEQAEHPDVTITAMDAVTRLPADLILDLVQKRDGLLGRLVEFHRGLIPPPPGGKLDGDWTEHWSNRAIISGMALSHMLKVKGVNHSDIKGEYIAGMLNNSIAPDEPRDPITSAKFYLAWHYLMFFNRSRSYRYALWFLDHIGSPSPSNPLPLLVEFEDTRQVSAGGSFTTLVSPFNLHLEAMVHFACNVPDPDEDPDADFFIDTAEGLVSFHLEKISSRLLGEVSPDAVNCIAITVAAVHWRFRGNEPWSYPLTVDQKQLEHTLMTRFRALDKNKMLMENVTLALSVIGISKLESTIFKTLFLIIYPSLVKFGQHGAIATYPHFPQSLLRLARHNLGDKEMESRISEILGICADGDWVSPVHEVYGGDILNLIGTMLHDPGEGRLHGTSRLLDMIARISDDTQLLCLLQPGPTGLHQFHTRISQTLGKPVYIPDEFISKVLELNVSPGIQGPSEVQISFMMGILSHDMWVRYGYSMGVFFNQILDGDKELHWPAYFISAEVISSGDQDGTIQNRVPLKIIDPKDYAASLRYAYDETPSAYKSYVLLGESLLLLWRKAKRYYMDGHLPSDWNDSTVFKAGAVDFMLRYLHAIQDQKYSGVEWEILKDYFQRASEVSEDTNRQVSGYELVRKQQRHLKVEAALKQVDHQLRDLRSQSDRGGQDWFRSSHSVCTG